MSPSMLLTDESRSIIKSLVSGNTNLFTGQIGIYDLFIRIKRIISGLVVSWGQRQWD